MTLDKAYNEFRKAQQSFFDDEEPEKKPKEVAKPTPPETQQTPVQAVEPKIGKPEANAPASFEHTPAAMPKQTGASLENIAYAQHFMKELPREVQDWINTDLNNPDGRYHEFLKPEGLDLKSYFAAMDEDYVNRSQHKDVITDTLKHKTGAGKGLEDQQVLPGKNEAISEAKVEEMIDANDRERWNDETAAPSQQAAATEAATARQHHLRQTTAAERTKTRRQARPGLWRDGRDGDQPSGRDPEGIRLPARLLPGRGIQPGHLHHRQRHHPNQ